MKKIFLLLLYVFSTFTSCNSQTSKYVKNLKVNEFKEQIAEKEVQLIDVRTPKEFKEGAIKNAKLINFYADDFKENLLTLDVNQPVYVYCQGGNRSGKASKILMDLGFKYIYDLEGGYKAWKQQKGE